MTKCYSWGCLQMPKPICWWSPLPSAANRRKTKVFKSTGTVFQLGGLRAYFLSFRALTNVLQVINSQVATIDRLHKAIKTCLCSVIPGHGSPKVKGHFYFRTAIVVATTTLHLPMATSTYIRAVSPNVTENLNNGDSSSGLPGLTLTAGDEVIVL